MKKKLLLIGCGPTNSLIAYNISKCQNLSKFFEVHIWEKSDKIGGRFATLRNPHNSESFVDLGAQYLTQTISRSWSKSYFDDLLKINLISPLDSSKISGFHQDKDKLNYFCPNGLSSIVNNFIERAGYEVKKNATVEKLTISDDNKVKFSLDDFHFVVSTIPVPELLQLSDFQILLKSQPTLKTNLENIKYSSRFALGLFFNNRVHLKENENAINFVQNSPIIRYRSLENEKRNDDKNSNNAAILIHTSVGFGEEQSMTDESIVQKIIEKEAYKVIKSISGLDASFSICHKYKYSQVQIPYQNSPGFVEIHNEPPILLAGDGFTYSGFEGCLFSANKTVEYLQNFMS